MMKFKPKETALSVLPGKLCAAEAVRQANGVKVTIPSATSFLGSSVHSKLPLLDGSILDNQKHFLTGTHVVVPASNANLFDMLVRDGETSYLLSHFPNSDTTWYFELSKIFIKNNHLALRIPNQMIFINHDYGIGFGSAVNHRVPIFSVELQGREIFSSVLKGCESILRTCSVPADDGLFYSDLRLFMPSKMLGVDIFDHASSAWMKFREGVFFNEVSGMFHRGKSAYIGFIAGRFFNRDEMLRQNDALSEKTIVFSCFEPLEKFTVFVNKPD